MRILIISDRFPPFYEGGYELRCQETVDALRKRGHDIFIITSKYKAKKDDENKNIFRILECAATNEYKTIFKNKIIKQICWAISLRKNSIRSKRIFKKIKPDLIYAWQVWDISIYPVAAISKYKVPILFDVGDYSLINSFQYHQVNIVKKLYHRLLTGYWTLRRLKKAYMRFISQYLMNCYKNKIVNEKNKFVIFKGIDIQLIDRKYKHREGGGSIKIFYGGRLVREKGVDILIEALKEVVDSGEKNGRDVLLTIVGDGPNEYKQIIKNRIRDFRLESYITMLGQIPRAELLNIMHEHDILVYPSIWDEPFPGTILEGMSQGVAVIGTNVGGIPELVVNNENGLLVEPNSPRAISEAIERLYGHNDLREYIINQASRTVSVKFNNENLFIQLESKMREIIERQKE